ncbi:MAG TPA: carbohydrate-binding protein [Actinophytocola sp.]|jgi:hypothetical protein|uniref:carbohydrate-binding protein n=1 Tax=Actinophytocola sp. TaxID=1872138 RepID=UPI002E05AD52|nr:carbohydrate-binding protein [Actinophytocola sp.]
MAPLLASMLLAAAVGLSSVDIAGAAPEQSAPVGGVVPGLTGAAAQEAAGEAAVRFKELTPARVARAEADLHTAWGIFFNDNASTGLQATHTVLNITTTGGDFVYAPTALPPGGACTEMTTAYTPTGPKLWAWDWCDGRDTIGKIVNMDAAFLNTYTTTVNGHRAYTMDEHRTSVSGNVWSVFLFNYQTNAWDLFYSSGGTKDIPGSTWDFFEIYTTVNPATGAGFYCQNLAGLTLEASAVKVMQNGTWVPASSSNSSLSSPPAGSRFDCPSLTFTIVHANDDWIARIGPPAQGTSFEAEASGNTRGGQAAVRSSSGASGGALVGWIGNGTANFLQFNNITGTAGAHQITIFYASGANRSLTISANGGAATSVNTPTTGGWDTVGSVTTTVNLNAGTNILRIGNPTGWAPDIDRIMVL